ncbi:hypothetical protein FRC98_09900 [Lujinxingia vulgaris]|uniref:Putative Flp pilus-assembly TadG-like N-terminal domain-containing protein n=1 Tax=Lujinxingia vulgaris TaxID=2600176 RepID=A0A5C6XE03_9DELT|nr:pilus assembly protein TadG-related protein [Lujinxingia vulgaris]TXD37043.1 hypothetical protein FRC98_09900 [Lujinxingia vulgaris]
MNEMEKSEEVKSAGLSARLQRLHQEQRGALALLCLAGLMILLMMGLVVYDATEVANEKVHVQASADASAYSQAAINARTMNMLAFANVGKRVNIGMVAAYETVYSWMTWITGVAWVLTIACYLIAAIPGAQAVAQLCTKMAEIAVGASCATAKEAGDYLRLDTIVQNFFGPEQRAFNNYQQYMADVTPYWSWTQGVWRGFTNNAPLTVGYPAPKNDADITFRQQLPVRVPAGHSWDGLCEKANEAPPIFGGGFEPGNIIEQADRRFMFVDFLIKNALGSNGNEDPAGGVDGAGDGGSGVGGSGGGQGGGSGSGQESACESLEEEAANDPNSTFEPPREECEVDENGNETDDCETIPGSYTVDGHTIELGEGCIPTSVLEQLDNVDCTQGGATIKAGAYGATYLAGLLGLLIDTSDIPSILKRLTVMPDSFVERCKDGTRDRYQSAGGFHVDGPAWELQTDNWLMNSSTLMYAYRPNAARNGTHRDRYQFMGEDSNPGLLNFASEGTWAISRGEIAWQGDEAPSLWESKWAARVRPVALDGEWEAYAQSHQGFSIWRGLRDIQGEVLATLLVAHGADATGSNLITHGYSLSPGSLEALLFEALSTRAAFDAMEPERMEGVVK